MISHKISIHGSAFTIFALCLSLSMGCGKGCASSEEPTEKNTTADDQARPSFAEHYAHLSPEEQVKAVIFDAQNGGFVQHNMEKFTLPLSDNAVSILKRSADDEKYNIRFDKNQLEAASRILFSQGGLQYDTLEHANHKVTLEGQSATVVLDATATIKDKKSTTRETYKLEKTSRGWEIVERVEWPLSEQVGTKTTELSDMYWKKADAAVTDARSAKDAPRIADSLWKARRYNHAYTARANLIAAKENPSAQDWVDLGHASIAAGHISSAMRCFERAKKLDENIAMPSAGAAFNVTKGEGGGLMPGESHSNDAKGPDEYTPDVVEPDTAEGEASPEAPAQEKAPEGKENEKPEATDTELPAVKAVQKAVGEAIQKAVQKAAPSTDTPEAAEEDPKEKKELSPELLD